MIGRLRDLLDRPLDPRHAHAIAAVAAGLTVAFASLVGLGLLHSSSRLPGTASATVPVRPTAPPPLPVPSPVGGSPDHEEEARRSGQDPQDRRGSADYRRARRALREHRALQHLPIHAHGVSMVLVGADRGSAVIRVAASTVAQARRAWRRFLSRCHDDGHEYVVRFTVAAIARPSVPRSKRADHEGGSRNAR